MLNQALPGGDWKHRILFDTIPPPLLGGIVLTPKPNQTYFPTSNGTQKYYPHHPTTPEQWPGGAWNIYWVQRLQLCVKNVPKGVHKRDTCKKKCSIETQRPCRGTYSWIRHHGWNSFKIGNLRVF
jgi:hypothetical protein